MSDCIFCKIIEGKIPSTRVFEDSNVIGLVDLHPQAKVHILFIHKKHTHNINQLTHDDPHQLIHLFEGIKTYTENEGHAQKGFRVVTNHGADAGQTVFHTHLHVLAGEPLGSFGS